MFRDVHRRRALLCALGTSAAVAVAAPSPALAGCSGAKAQAAAASPGKLRSAMHCLVNRKREAHGLAALRVDRKIQKAAGRHARDMAAHDYFAHQRPGGGPDLGERLERAGWRGVRWGETIAYGCGSLSSPKATLKAWMNSPPHREVILSSRYKRGGIGLAEEAPCGADGAMWVLDVGRR
jgi:uncharacterized protein YkwD